MTVRSGFTHNEDSSLRNRPTRGLPLQTDFSGCGRWRVESWLDL